METRPDLDPDVVYVPEAERNSPNPSSWIEKTPDVCGGDARIRRMRIPVCLLVEYRRAGLSDKELLASYPLLTPADLSCAWEYYGRHKEEIDQAIREEEMA
jgi:type III restriction enzyme